jgi:hypothetical protein
LSMIASEIAAMLMSNMPINVSIIYIIHIIHHILQ